MAPHVERPLSPPLQIYRWQVQMVTSILHRFTGLALAAGMLLVTWGILALASGADAWGHFTAFTGSFIGVLLLIGWSWALFYHLCNGIRHLLQDAGLGFDIQYRGKHNVNQATFVRSSWLAIIFSIALTIICWIIVGVAV